MGWYYPYYTPKASTPPGAGIASLQQSRPRAVVLQIQHQHAQQWNRKPLLQTYAPMNQMNQSNISSLMFQLTVSAVARFSG
jgi:hypothetical protein